MSTSQAVMALVSTDMRSMGAGTKSQQPQSADDGEAFAGLLAAQLPEELESAIQQLTPEELHRLEQAALAADGNSLPGELQDWLQQLPDEHAPVAEDALAMMGQWMQLQQDGASVIEAGDEGASQKPLLAGKSLGNEAIREQGVDAVRPNLTSAASQTNQLTGGQQDMGALLQRAASEPGPTAAALFGKLIEQMDGARNGRADDAEILDGINRAGAQSQASAAALTARPVTGAMQPDSVPFGHQSWGQNMVERVMWMSSQNLRSVEIQLDPAELGPLEIHIQNRGQELQVQFVSQNPGVREALEGQMHRLREMFAGQGLEQADVTVADRSAGEQTHEDQRQMAERGAGQGTVSGGTGAGAEADLTEQLVERAMQPLRGLVDYYV